MMENNPVWHKVTPQQAAELLASNLESGLTEEEAKRRARPRSRRCLCHFWRGSLLNQLFSAATPLLLAAIALFHSLGEGSLAVVAAATLSLRLITGTIWEWLAVREENRLESLNGQSCRVLRNGRQQSLPRNELVPGDLVLLTGGNLVPGTLRLISSQYLSVEERNRRGKIITLQKEAHACLPEKTVVSARTNMLYDGQIVNAGYGRGLLVSAPVDSRPFTNPVNSLRPCWAGIEWFLALGALAAALLVSYCGLQSGEIVYQMVITGLTLALAAQPPHLFPLVYLTQIYWSRRLNQEGSALNNSSVLAKLAGMNTVIGDHDFLLAGKARVEQIVTWAGVSTNGGREENVGGGLSKGPGQRFLTEKLLQTAFLCHDHTQSSLSGALSEAVEENGLTPERIRDEFGERLDTARPAGSSSLKSALYRRCGRSVLFVSGNLEEVLERCQRIDTGLHTLPLNLADREDWSRRGKKMAGEGLQAIALAYREFSRPDDRITPGYFEPSGLIWLGLLAVRYNPGPEAALAIRDAERAGIDTWLVTGADPAVAGCWGKELGLLAEGEPVTLGRELTGSERQLAKLMGRSRVIAGIRPEQRLAIVKSCRRAGRVAAYVGGNQIDLPAVETADVGVISEPKPTPREREKADLLLPGGKLVQLLQCVALARGAHDNIRRLPGYAFTCSLSVITALLLPLIAGFPLTLLPIQLLWVNLIISSLPAVAIALEPPAVSLTGVSTEFREKKIVTGGIILKSLGWGCLTGLVSAVVFVWLLGRGQGGLVVARCGAFFTLTLTQLFLLWVWRGRGGRNLWRLVGLSAGLLLMWPALYWTVHTLKISLNGGDWLVICLGAGLIMVIDSFLRMMEQVRIRKAPARR